MKCIMIHVAFIIEFPIMSILGVSQIAMMPLMKLKDGVILKLMVAGSVAKNATEGDH